MGLMGSLQVKAVVAVVKDYSLCSTSGQHLCGDDLPRHPVPDLVHRPIGAASCGALGAGTYLRCQRFVLCRVAMSALQFAGKQFQCFQLKDVSALEQVA